jgi:hypothetical protein
MDITAELVDIAKLGGFFAISIGGDDGGWRPITACYAEGYADLIAAEEARIAASLAQFSLASRLWSPALACALVHGIVPDFADVQRAHDSSALRLPDPTGIRVDDADALPETLYAVVVQQHLERFAGGLRVKTAPGLLYGNAASAMVAATRALYGIRPHLRDSGTRLARSLLETGRLAGTGTVKHNLAFRRRSCCLYYHTPGGSKCGDCGLVK